MQKRKIFHFVENRGLFLYIDSLDFLCMIGENTLSEKNLKFNTFF